MRTASFGWRTLAIVAAVLFSAPAYAQAVTSSTITGTVTDAAGQPLPSANVVATHLPSGTEYGTASRVDGSFTLPNVRVGGPYRVRATFLGFRTFEEEGFRLTLGDALELDIVLQDESAELGGGVVGILRNHRGNVARDLKVIAVLIGEATDELDLWLEATYVTYNERLWFEHEGRYCPFDLRNTRLLVENDCATFMSLFANLASSQRAKRLIYEHLCNAAAYAPCDPGMGQPTTFWLPSLAKTSLFYEPRRYWRGPAWVLMNWFVAEGLDNYNYHTLAENIRQHTLALVAKSGFTEYYDPRDGSPAGATGFSWSAALTLELLADHVQ